MKTFFKRLFLFLFSVGLPLALWAFWLEPNSLRMERVTIALPEEMHAWRGMKIAIIADLHGGAPFINEDKIDAIVERTLAEKPDLIYLAGDYVIQGVRFGTYMPIDTITRHLSKLHAPLGIYAVLGNHDHWDKADNIAAVLEKSGVHVLEDSTTFIKYKGIPLRLVGFSDFATGKRDYAEAYKSVAKEEFPLCLTHSPDAFPVLPPHCQLTLSGHTHGGQVKLPLFGTPLVPSIYGSRFIRGVIREPDKRLKNEPISTDIRTVYVSSGIGTSGLAVRFGVPPEINIVTLR